MFHSYNSVLYTENAQLIIVSGLDNLPCKYILNKHKAFPVLPQATLGRWNDTFTLVLISHQQGFRPEAEVLKSPLQ